MLYRTYTTQQEIDQEYNPRLIVDNFELNVKNYFTESKRVLKEYHYKSGVAYEPTKPEILDIFHADIATAPQHRWGAEKQSTDEKPTCSSPVVVAVGEKESN